MFLAMAIALWVIASLCASFPKQMPVVLAVCALALIVLAVFSWASAVIRAKLS